MFLFTTALIALVPWLAPQLGRPPLNPASYTDKQLLFNLLLMQSWGFTSYLNWNYPAWSVSAEWFCYLFFPLAALAAARMGRWGTVAGVMLRGAVMCATGTALVHVFVENPSRRLLRARIDACLPARDARIGTFLHPEILK